MADTISERERMQPALAKAAEAVCIYQHTDGFCHPRNNPACRCWQMARDVQQATGLSSQAVQWIFKNTRRIEDEAASTPTPASPPATAAEAAESVALALQVAGELLIALRRADRGEPHDDIKALRGHLSAALTAAGRATPIPDAITALFVAAKDTLVWLRLGSHRRTFYDHDIDAKLSTAIDAAGQATPSEPADRRRERLLDERHRLENSYGNTPARDGQIRDRIAEIDAQLAGPSSQGAPTDAE